MKEYNNEGKGSLWLADKQTRDGDNYYNGNITIDGKEHKITMFINKSDNEKAPKFRLKVNTAQNKTPNDFNKTSYTPSELTEDEMFKEFGDTVELNEDEIAF